MPSNLTIREKNQPYFITMTVVAWIDVFTRSSHKLIIVDALKYCQEHKGLLIYGWCLMSNHLHIIASTEGDFHLRDVVRDFKKFTSKKIVGEILEGTESRSRWMLANFYYAGKYLNRIKNYKLWKDGNHALVIYSPAFFYQKLNYIHNNPVKAMIVERPDEYLFSSARNYADRDALIDVILESAYLKTY
jgi:putative transposase